MRGFTNLLRSCSKQVISYTAGLFYIVIVYFIILSYSDRLGPHGDAEENRISGETRRGNVIGETHTAMDFILILCGGQGTQGSKVASDINRQIRQADVMLKSAVLLSNRKMHFHVIADSKNLYYRLVNRTTKWPEKYQKKLHFTMHDVWYPEERQGMKSMFRVCATERLFVPDMFPKIKKAIYIDTDLIFLRPVEDLWRFFDDFDDDDIAAMAPCMYHYGTPRNKIPYYGETGLNAGIMHMNLDRMRQIPDGWTNANMAMFDKYKSRIKLADQDILNILFHFYPDKLFELPCEWNYRVWLCSSGENKCPGAEENGVAVLHGNALAFVKGHEMKLQAVFQTFERFDMNKDELEGGLYNAMIGELGKVDREDGKSKCKAVPGIDRIILKELERHIPNAVPV